MSANTDDTTITLDVRPVLAAGDEPFQLIMETADRVPEGGNLELTAPFEPVPLYRVMARRGFGHATESLDGGDYRVRFVHLAIAPESTVADVYERYPVTTPVFAEFGLDCCCGGTKSLTFASQAHGIDLDQLLQALHRAVVE